MAHGFVLGELLFAIGSFGLLWAAMEAVEPSLERACIGSGTRSNDVVSGTVVADVRRWVCVPLSIETPELSLARTRVGVRHRQPR